MRRKVPIATTYGNGGMQSMARGRPGARPTSRCRRLAAFALAAMLLCAAYWSATPPSTGSLRGSAATTTAAATPRGWYANATAADHLIMVAGHAVLDHSAGGGVSDGDDAAWVLLPYQRDQGLGASFVAHVERGVREAAADPRSLVVFSGGQTRPDAGPWSEGASYWQVASAHGWFGTPGVAHRAAAEEYARDSFENLLFSLCRFKEATGRYPARTTVVSYAFKKDRFLDLHAKALRLPNVDFAGTDPPAGAAFDLEAATAGERANGYGPFVGDPYGCADPVLVSKRQGRTPFLCFTKPLINLLASSAWI